MNVYNLRDEITVWLQSKVFPIIGMDRPSNMEELITSIVEDVLDTVALEGVVPNTSHFGTSFRRFIETCEEGY